MINRIIFFVLFIFIIYACKRPSEGSKKAGEHITNLVVAALETTPTPQKSKDDSADDPAFWINPSNPGNSVIIGTDKKGGLITYNLKGEQLKYYPFGLMNNCDLRYGFVLDKDTIDVLAASNRSTQSLSLYRISKEGVLDSIHSRIIKTEMMEEVYGLCMYKSRETGKMYAFMNSKAGEIEQYELFAENKKIDARLVRTIQLETQTEGMVADDETGKLYIGEEDAGIWKFDAEPTGSLEGVLIPNSSEENQNIKY